jgi:tRNA G18 (ribose-2'-O)-methylase SpoU
MAPTHVPIQDPADPRLAAYVGLTDAQLRRAIEAPDPDAPVDHGSFIVEGHLAIEALVASPYPVRSLLVSESQSERLAPVVIDLDPSVPMFVAPQDVVEATVGFRLHRGVVACAARLARVDPTRLVEGARRVLVIEGVNDHENLGGLFRNAAAFGVDAVLLDPTTADPLYRRSVRVSLGHVLRVPFGRLAPWPEALGVLHQAGFETVALTPDPAAAPIEDAAAGLAAHDQAPPLALVLGAEGPGLSAAVRRASDRQVRIPMAPGVDSLNVATAAAVALHALRPAPPRDVP